MYWGMTVSSMKRVVSRRAAACVAGATYVCGNPAPARKLWPGVAPIRPFSLAERHVGVGVSVQADGSFSSLCNCGGNVIEAKFWNFQPYDTPKPARTAVLPSPRGSHARPTRGPKLFLSVFGLPKVITPGTLEIAFRACVSSPTGLVQYSYLIPRLSVRHGFNL